MEAVLLDQALGQSNDAQRQCQSRAEPEQRRQQAVQPALDRQQQDDVAAPGAECAADPQLRTPFEGHQREHQHDQQHSAEQRERSKHHEQIGECAPPPVGLILSHALHVDDSKATRA